MTDKREAFERWVKETGAFTDWSRYGDGYAKPLVDRTWQAWCAAIAWQRADDELRLPGDWYVDHDGQRLVLDAAKVEAEIARLRARETLLNSVVERQALALMKIRVGVVNSIQIAREAMDEK